MPKIAYKDHSFKAEAVATIEQANEIIDEYVAQGYRLTLRQLYYQFVARGLLDNKFKEYKRLGNVINDARLAGYVDWLAIEDRTRGLASLGHWDDPADMVASAAAGYRIDKWEDQQYRVEVWVEKEALAGVFERVCHELDIPMLSCRGYTSASEMWLASRRLLRYQVNGQEPLILHFGDHDPSGVDMTRDIVDRLETFGLLLDLRRMALNMDQVEEYNPPPNPVKETDSRHTKYTDTYGTVECWELDAMEPDVLAQLVRDEVATVLDDAAWEAKVEEEDEGRTLLQATSHFWPQVVPAVRTLMAKDADWNAGNDDDTD